MDDSARVRRAFGHTLPEDAVMPAPREDLARARAALRARSRARFRIGLGALAVALVAGVGVAGALDRTAQPENSASPAGADSIHLLATTFVARPYSFDLTPSGWSVQSRSPYGVTIVPDDGSTSSDPDVFVGKLVITFDHNPVGTQVLAGAGRRVWIHEDSGYTTLSMPTEGGEPAGVVRIQYPDNAGWDRSTMARFLRSVHVGAGAKASLG
jgi:hypothetical protein